MYSVLISLIALLRKGGFFLLPLSTCSYILSLSLTHARAHTHTHTCTRHFPWPHTMRIRKPIEQHLLWSEISAITLHWAFLPFLHLLLHSIGPAKCLPLTSPEVNGHLFFISHIFKERGIKIPRQSAWRPLQAKAHPLQSLTFLWNINEHISDKSSPITQKSWEHLSINQTWWEGILEDVLQ